LNNVRLIDADALKSKIREQSWKQETKVSLMLDWIYMLIDEASTVSTVQNKALQAENEQLRAKLGDWKYEVQCHMDEVTARDKEIDQLLAKLDQAAKCLNNAEYYEFGKTVFLTREEAEAAWNRRADARQLALKTRVCPMCEDCPDGCPVETPKDSRNIVTNAQRIRSMSDEELARFLGDEPPYFSTYEKYLDWLKQPYKEWGKCDRFFIDDGGQCSAPSCWDTDKRDYRIGVKCGGNKAKCCLSDQYT
jgi:regulator of replication initiation timing